MGWNDLQLTQIAAPPRTLFTTLPLLGLFIWVFGVERHAPNYSSHPYERQIRAFALPIGIFHGANRDEIIAVRA
jgi:hypothetical protein